MPYHQGLIYEGNNDIICNHGGVVALLENMSVWEGKDEYYGARNEVSSHYLSDDLQGIMDIIVISALQDQWKTGRLREVGEEAEACNAERRWPRSSTQSARGCFRHVQKLPWRKCKSDTLNIHGLESVRFGKFMQPLCLVWLRGCMNFPNLTDS